MNFTPWEQYRIRVPAVGKDKQGASGSSNRSTRITEKQEPMPGYPLTRENLITTSRLIIGKMLQRSSRPPTSRFEENFGRVLD